MKLWIVFKDDYCCCGQERIMDEFCGIFSNEASAINACQTEKHWIVPWEVDTENAGQVEDWEPGEWYAPLSYNRHPSELLNFFNN